MNKNLTAFIVACALFGSAVFAPVTAAAAETKEMSSAVTYAAAVSKDDYDWKSIDYKQWGDYEYYENEDSTLTISSYLGDNTEIEIPSQIDGKTVSALGEVIVGFRSTVEKVIIPETITSIGKDTFSHSTSIKEFQVNENNEYFTADNGVLFDKSKKKLVCFPTVFSGEYTVPDGVEEICIYAFLNNNELTKITLPDSVKSIGYGAFSYCFSLEQINLPESLESIGDYAFSYCGLTSVTIPSKIKKVSSYTFYNCESLKEIQLPENLESIEWNAFLSSGLTSLFIPASVSQIQPTAFGGCADLTELTVDENNQYFTIEDQVLFSKDKSILYVCPASKEGDYTIPDGVQKIADTAFYCCENLSSVQFSDSVLEIGESAFFYCTKLTMAHLNNGLLKICASSFNSCDNLREITLPDSLTFIGSYAFSRCANLTGINIPASVSEIDEIETVFASCTKLKEIYIDENNSLLSSENGVLYNKDKTSLILFPANSEINQLIIPDTVKYIESMAFSSSHDLKEVVIPDSVTEIGEGVFSESSIESVTLSKSMKTIPFDTFYLCSSLKNIELPDSIESIQFSAFNMCSSLETLYIPSTVKEIAYWVFDGCDNLTLYVEKGSYAEKYAKEMRLDYKSITDIKALKGDVDGDGELTSVDALYTLRASVGLETLDDAERVIADIDNDNNITSADALEILRLSVGITSAENVSTPDVPLP